MPHISIYNTGSQCCRFAADQSYRHDWALKGICVPSRQDRPSSCLAVNYPSQRIGIMGKGLSRGARVCTLGLQGATEAEGLSVPMHKC